MPTVEAKRHRNRLYHTHNLLRKPNFVESGLYRKDKTERKTGQTTYLDMTMRNAMRKRRNPPMKR